MRFTSSLVKDVRAVFHEELDPGQRAALVSWLAFTATFGAVRGITYSIKEGKGPFRNLSVGGAHLHHYMWGIGLVSGVGGVAVHGEDARRRHPAVAFAYGTGLALIVDEFALLLDLKDVYWAKQGRISVDLGIGASSLAGPTSPRCPCSAPCAAAHDRLRAETGVSPMLAALVLLLGFALLIGWEIVCCARSSWPSGSGSCPGGHGRSPA